MARQSYYSQPWRKNLEVYQDFSGGMNVETSVEKLQDNESTLLQNVDLDDRGSLKRRNGFKVSTNLDSYGTVPKGVFQYFTGTSTHELFIVDGKLYRTVVGEIPIEGMTSLLTVSSVEAAQLGDKLYLATGQGLIVYDGETAKVVDPYKPDPMEALEIGTNALAPNPNSYLEDGEAVFLRIDGVIPLDLQGNVMSHGLANKTTEFHIYVSKPVGSVIEYKLEYRETGSDTWLTQENWNENRVKAFKRGDGKEFEIRALARVQGSADDPAEYYFPSWPILSTRKDPVQDVTGIHSCNKILVHHNRLYLYGSSEQRTRVFISHLNQGDYFPVSNTLDFENPRAERLEKLVQYRNSLVGFTKSTVQALYGRSAADFRRAFLNTTIGSESPESVKVHDNELYFLSIEGLYKLKTLAFDEARANVERVDQKIQKEIQKLDAWDRVRVIGAIHDNQYHLFVPTKNIRYRYYFNYRTWVKDVSEKLDVKFVYVRSGVMSLVREGSPTIFVFQPDVFTDDGFAYEMRIDTKFFTFGQPHHQKKLKEVHLLLGHFKQQVPTKVFVYADSYLALNPSKGEAVVNEDGDVEWVVSDEPNVVVQNGTIFGGWDLGQSHFGEIDASIHELKLTGKCRRTKLTIIHEDDSPFALFGVGYIFKIKGV